MALDAAGVQAIFDAIQSHAMSSGYFEKVNTHEPKKAPKGMIAAIWLDSFGPQIGESGLDATSVRLVFNVRLMRDMIREPQDAIDPAMLTAAAGLMESYSGAFTLGGSVAFIDLIGNGGIPLSAQAGYISQDHKMLRTITIIVPAVVHDAWTQTA